MTSICKYFIVKIIK